MRGVLPSWFSFLATHKLYLLIATFILVLASFFRLYKLGEIPAGLTWDEAAIGYNGSAIWRTRRDEWLVRLPVSFKSFGDYKAPLAIYLNSVFTAVFGLTAWAVRLPFALIGILTVGLVIGFVYLVFANIPYVSKPISNFRLSILTILSLVGGGLIATSPWHIHFSRAGFESGIALCFVVLFLILFVFSQKESVEKNNKYFLLVSVLSGVFASLSAYAYHSAKVAVPLLIGVGFLTSKLSWRKRWLQLFTLILTVSIVSYPLITDMLYANGAERLNQTSLFSRHTSLEIPFVIARNFWAHFSLPFLLGGQTTTLRHGDGHWGVFFISEWLLIVLGVLGVIVWLKKRTHSTELREVIRIFLFSIGIIISGIFPAAIGVEIPHANRVLLAYPGFLLLACLGVYFLLQFLYGKTGVSSYVKNPKLLIDAVLEKTIHRGVALRKYYIMQCLIGMTLLIHCLLLLSFWSDYQTKYYVDSASSFQYGYEQAFRFAIEREESVDKILFTSKYGQPYIYALFFRQTNPIWYQGGSLIKYEFTNQISDSDLVRQNTVIIADPDQIDPNKADELVIAPDGSVRFILIHNQ